MGLTSASSSWAVEAIAAMKRSAPPGEFRANIHKGASGEIVTLPEAYDHLAIEATAALELEIAGVDLLETNNGTRHFGSQPIARV